MAKRKKKNKFEFIKKLWRKWQTPPPPKEKFLLRKKIAQEWREISITEVLIWFSAFVSVGHFADYIDSWLGAIVVDIVIVLLVRSILRNKEQKVFSFWEWFAILIYTVISAHANIDYYERLGDTNPIIKGALWPFSVLVLTLVKTSAVRLFNDRRKKYENEIIQRIKIDNGEAKKDEKNARRRADYAEKKRLGLIPSKRKDKTENEITKINNRKTKKSR